LGFIGLSLEEVMDLVFLALCLCFFAASAIVLYNQAPERSAPEKRAPKRSTSIYSPLPPGTGRIRLLRLMPSRNAAAAIECQLFEYHLGSSETTHLYEALSYAWGDERVMKDICIGEHRFKIRENLHQALLRLRNHSMERILWVDAICIDQKNKLERGDQIRHMVKIYSQASRVIVWLGDAGNNSDQVFDYIRAAAEDDFKNSPGDKKEEKVLDLLDRPWFRRMWVREIIR
jgi:Heterokaryon incompatibility protein (HET)